MKNQLSTKNTTTILTLASLLLVGGATLSYFNAKNERGKALATNVGILSLGLLAGSSAAKALIKQKIDGANATIQEKFADAEKAKFKLEAKLNDQNKVISKREAKISNLERLIAEKDFLINKLQIALKNLQIEYAAKHKELDAKLAKENTDREDLYNQLIKEFLSDLRYKVEDGYTRLTDSLEHKLSTERYEDVHKILTNFRTKLLDSCKRADQQLLELQELEATDKITSEITDIYFQISNEIAVMKVQYRNILNTSAKLTAQEFERELEERRNPTNFVPRQKVLTGLDVMQQQYSETKQILTSAIKTEKTNLSSLRDNVNDLVDEIDSKNIEIADLKNEINEHRKPLKWVLAQSRELQIGNLVIDYFWKQGTGYYLDRSFHETDGYDCKLYFQIDRNPRQVVESELNEHSEGLQQYCNVLKPITFKYSGTKGLMVATVLLREKPVVETSRATIDRICKPHAVFAAAVGGYERWRITGGSQAGKSPTAQFVANAITKYNSKPVKVRLFNPQSGSKKDNWSVKAEGHNAEECLDGFKRFNQELKDRQSGRKSTDEFELFIFDELDAVIEECGSKEIRSPLLAAIKQASHQDLGSIIIGQSCAANVVSKFTWSDWNSTAQLHIGENAKLFIENRWKNEPEVREDYLSRYNKIRDFFQKQNEDSGLSIAEYGYYRFAFVAVPNQKPFFIELPPFLFEPKTPDELPTYGATTEAKPEKPTQIAEALLASAEKTPPTCPKCGSTNTRTNGANRLRCKDCDKSWSRK
jgi:hypothetical protein